MATSKEEKQKYLEWLVESRSRNQATTLRIWKISRNYRDQLQASVPLTHALNWLAGAVFSLWRAVFLCDGVDDDMENFHRDTEAFLENLVHNNAVAYPQDKAAQFWSFRYYASNAHSRLKRLLEPLGEENVRLLLGLDEDTGNFTAQQWWELQQTALEQAVANFEALLSASAPRS